VSALLYCTIRMADAWARWALNQVLPAGVVRKVVLGK